MKDAFGVEISKADKKKVAAGAAVGTVVGHAPVAGYIGHHWRKAMSGLMEGLGGVKPGPVDQAKLFAQGVGHAYHPRVIPKAITGGKSALMLVPAAAGGVTGGVIAHKKAVSKKITQQDGKYVAMSEDGSRKFGTYGSLNQAKRRLHQVEYFKAKSAAKRKESGKKGAIGAAGGATAAHALYLSAGYTANHATQREFDKTKNSKDPNIKWKRAEKGAWFKHQSPPPGFRNPNKWRDSPQFYRSFPKELPGWKTRRLLGYTHGGKIGHAVAVANMAAGATIGYKASKDKVKKSITFRPKYGWKLKSLTQSGLMVPAGTIATAGAAGYVAGKRKKRKK